MAPASIAQEFETLKEDVVNYSLEILPQHKFAVLNDAMLQFLFARAASDLHVPSGLMVTSSMVVNYKAGVPLDSIGVISCRLVATASDSQGRSRVQLEATMRMAGHSSELTLPYCTAAAEFVNTGSEWPGQALPIGSEQIGRNLTSAL